MTDHDTYTHSWQPKAGESLRDAGFDVQDDTSCDSHDWLARPMPRGEVQAAHAAIAGWLIILTVAGLLHLLWHWWAG